MSRVFIPRKGAPKSRRGCFTCKIRRIKCDETRPLCNRCTSTGRKCDGYADQCASDKLTVHNLTALTEMDLPGDTVQQRSFAFFNLYTVPNLSFLFGSPLWVLLALRASQSEPGLHCAAVALGALHEHLESGESLAGISITGKIEYAAQQYTQALKCLRRLLTKSDKHSLQLALLGALMCMYYEVLQRNFTIVQMHLENCLNVLRPLVSSHGTWLTHFTSNKMLIDDDIIQSFAHLDIEASCTLGTRSPSFCILATPLEIPTFASITQAREFLYALTSQLHTFMRSTADVYKTTIMPIPLPIIAEANFLQTQLRQWSKSFSTFFNCPSTKLSRQEQQVANILFIQQKVTYMKAASCLHANEMIFDEFDKDFEEILCLAEYLICLKHISDESKGDRCFKGRKNLVFTFDMGIIEALFWTAIKCRSHDFRYRTIEALRKVTWQEGVWNSAMMTAIAERFVEMEEAGVRFGGERGRLPEARRLHDHGWEMDVKKRKIAIRAGRRENGVDGEWTWLMEEVVW